MVCGTDSTWARLDHLVFKRDASDVQVGINVGNTSIEPEFGQSSFWSGFIYSIAIFDTALGDTARINIERNFAQRYGIPMGTYENIYN